MKENLNPIKKRIAVKITAELASPTLIGSGDSEHTDSDVLLDSLGKPYLPGSALAGVLRSRLSKSNADKLFGDDVSREEKMSALWVMDSAFEKAEIIELDGAALDYNNKVALDKKKYDFEAVGRSAVFTMRFMLIIRENDDSAVLEHLLYALLSDISGGLISVGAKTNRGFGRVLCKNEEIKTQIFDFTVNAKAALNRYEHFEWSDPKNWTVAQIEKPSSDIAVITKRLRLKGSIMIRDTRNPYRNEDYKHMSERGDANNGDGIPVIYGTSWAGALRSGLYTLLKPIKGEETNSYLEQFFGFVHEKQEGYPIEETSPSKIQFDMSILETENTQYDGFRTITRVKINRFTGGAADGALFTERPWYGGKTTLTIRYPKGCQEIEKLLHLAFDAIDKGLITVGGETSVGRGVFEMIEEDRK